MRNIKIKVVVIDETALGHIHPEQPNYIRIISSSRIKNSIFNTHQTHLIGNSKTRLATKADLDEYRIHENNYAGRENEYELAIIKQKEMKFSTWFKEFPEKILGVLTEGTNQFGQKVMIVKGELSLLSKIDVSESLNPVLRDSAMEVDLDANMNIAESLRKTTIEKVAPKTAKPKKRIKSNNVYLEAIEESELFTEEEAFNILNKGFPHPDHLKSDFKPKSENVIDDNDVEVWVYYCLSKNRPVHPYLAKRFKTEYTTAWLKRQLENGFLCFDPILDEYIPRVIYFYGNIAEKIQALRNSSFSNETIIGEAQKERQLKQLILIQPNKLSLIGDVKYRLTIDPFSNFAKNHILDSDKSIYEEFKEWVYNAPEEVKKTTLSSWEISHYGMNNGRHSNGTDPAVKAQMALDIAIEIPNLMSVFLAELPHLDQQKIEMLWNMENNSFIDPDYNKVPLMFVFSKTFKNSPLGIRPEQREGVAFNEIHGTGVIGFDVGVGKTMTAILTFAQFMQSGRAFKPVLVVPKPTYGKWIGEMRGIFDDEGELIGTGILPQYQINSFYNLNKDIAAADLKVDPNTITIITFQGVKNIGFTDEYAPDFLSQVHEILEQGTVTEGITERQKEADKAKGETFVSKAQADNTVFMDELSFDYLCMDEAHNANKIFTSVKGNVNQDGQRENSRFGYSGGTASMLSIKMFFLSQFVQSNCKGQGNVQLLTATPFTNNPLNVYNIFALTNFSRLKEYGIENVNTFFEKYVEITVDDVVNSKGNIETKSVIKSWKNKVALQKIMFGIINYKGAKDSPSVKRPNKVSLPMLSETINGESRRLPADKQILTILEQTDRQRANRSEILADLEAAMQDSELSKKAPFLTAEISSSKNSLSPHIYEAIPPKLIDPKDFVAGSPKIDTMMRVIKGINDWFDARNSPRSCQIIYCATGIDYFPLMKQYMMENLGYKKNVAKYTSTKYFDEVEILAGSDISDDAKESLKQAFNDGVVKIIIGSSTIREGIDLQTRTSTLHSLWVDWNATDLKQLEGRAWRFGNMFDYVSIIQYLVQGGTDAFRYQKLQEKTGRTNDIFDRLNQENMLDVSDSDREAVKWELVDDIDEVVKQQVKALVNAEKRKISVLNSYVDQYKSFESDFNSSKDYEERLRKVYNEVLENNHLLELDLEDKTDYLEVLKTVNRNRRKILEVDGLPYYVKQRFTDGQIASDMKRLKAIKDKLNRLDEYSLKTTNQSIYEVDVPFILNDLASKIETINVEIQELESPGRHEEMFQKIEADRLAQNNDSNTPEVVSERILKLNDTVLNVITLKEELTKVEPSVEKPKRKLTEKFKEAAIKIKANEENIFFDVSKLDLESNISMRIYENGIDQEIDFILNNNYIQKNEFKKDGISWVYKNTNYEVKDVDLLDELRQLLILKNIGIVDKMRVLNQLPYIESKYGKNINVAKNLYEEARSFYQNKLRLEKSERANDVFLDYIISRLKESKQTNLVDFLKSKGIGDYSVIEKAKQITSKDRIQSIISKYNQWSEKSKEELISIKKHLYGNVDISSAKEVEEYILDRLINLKPIEFEYLGFLIYPIKIKKYPEDKIVKKFAVQSIENKSKNIKKGLGNSIVDSIKEAKEIIQEQVDKEKSNSIEKKNFDEKQDKYLSLKKEDDKLKEFISTFSESKLEQGRIFKFLNENVKKSGAIIKGKDLIENYVEKISLNSNVQFKDIESIPYFSVDDSNYSPLFNSFGKRYFKALIEQIKSKTTYDTKTQLKDAIEALSLSIDYVSGKDLESLKESIEALEISLDFI